MPAVLLDADGTLVDSNYHHAIAWSRALRDRGLVAPLAAIHRLIGMGASDLLERLIGHDDQAAQNAWRVHFDELLDEVRPTDGAGDLLRDLHGRGLTVVLATSAPDDLLTHFRAKIGADNAIDDVVSARDVDRAKPHPDIFEAALSKAGAAPTDAIVIGDSVWDLEAAAAASLPCIGLETGGFSRCELDHCGAVAAYKDPRDLLAHMDDSPIGGLRATAP